MTQNYDLIESNNNLLFRQLKEDSIQAFQTIYSAYKENVHYLVKSKITKSCDAEDLVQDVFMKLWEYRKEIDENRAPVGLLFRMTINKVHNYRRRVEIEKSYQNYILNSENLSFTLPMSTICSSEIKSKIEPFLKQLPSEQSDVFHLFWLKGMSRHQIAKQKGLSVRTIDNQMYRVKKEISKRISVGYFSL